MQTEQKVKTTTQFIKIKNLGNMDYKALTLIGASSKVGDETKIGQFGSGNKYAIAYLLRERHDIWIYSGTERIDVGTIEKEFRGQFFDIIYINGKETSITTAMGKDWELWQAIREIYCNALDEPEAEFGIVDGIEPAAGETHIYIKVNPAISEFMKDFDNYFATKKKVLFECAQGRILEKSGKHVNIYRKGINCMKSTLRSLFDYDLVQIEVDENRLIRYSWSVEEKVWDLIFRCTNQEVSKKILMGAKEGTFEGSVSSYSDVSASNISEECKEVFQSLKIAPAGYAGMLKPDEAQQYVITPTKVFEQVKPILANDNLGDCFKVYSQGMYREIECDTIQNSAIDSALGFLKLCDFRIPYVISTGIFSDKAIMGTSSEERIILSDICLERGTTEIINTIIEEYIHIKYGCRDESRLFQESIITEFISYMKKKLENKS